MTGIAGGIGDSLGDTSALGLRMVRSLRRSTGALVDLWRATDAILCQVTLDSSAAKIAVTADGTKRIALWGELLGLNEAETTDRYGPDTYSSPVGHLLSLYCSHGKKAFSMLDGSFAVAIYDASTGELVLANDRFSSRPLFWAPVSGGVVFATQVHAVLQSPLVPRTLDLDGVRQFFHYQRIHGTGTLNTAVKMLAPGTTLTSCRGRVTLEPWFQMEYRPEQRSDRDWAEELAAAFSASTRRAMAGAPRVGVLASGGLDSRMVSAAAERPIHAFHFNDWQNRECRLAERVSQARGFPFEYLSRSSDHYTRVLGDAVDIGDSLYRHDHAHALGLIPASRSDVLLHGFAPELFFRGTNLPHVRRTAFGRHLYWVVDPDVNAANVVDKMVAGLKYCLAARRPEEWFVSRLQSDFAAAVREPVEDLVAEAREASGDPYDWFIWADTRFHVKYPSFLNVLCLLPFHRERSVTLQNNILDLHLRMPMRMRSDSRIWNLAVKELNPRVARVPDANTGLPPLLPAFAGVSIELGTRLARRVKKPTPPAVAWFTQGSWPNRPAQLRDDRATQVAFENVLLDEEALDPEIFDSRRVRAALDEHFSGRRDNYEFLALMATFGEWHRRYGPSGRNLP